MGAGRIIAKSYKQLENQFVSSEQIRIACKSLQHTLGTDHEPKSLMVTSPRDHPDNSRIAIQLANAFAEQGVKVLLVDTHFKKPILHTLLNITNMYGFMDLIRGQYNSEELIIRTTNEYLHVLPSGGLQFKSLRVAFSERLHQLKKEFNSLYDLVIYNSPSLLTNSEAQDIRDVSDGIVLLVRENTTTNGEITLTLKSVERAGKQILGALYQTN